MENAQDESLMDCIYYLSGSCTKGEECPFRHFEPVLSNFSVCKFWISGSCKNIHCMFRHPKIKPKVEIKNSNIFSG
jgi:hypothetical protein